MLDILHHEQNSINKRFISEENITSIKKGEELVSAVLVKEDEALPRVLWTFIDNHKIIIITRFIMDKDEVMEALLAVYVVENMT